MKDSVWIFIKDSIMLPFIFVAETSFVQFSKSNKTKSKKYTKK